MRHHHAGKTPARNLLIYFYFVSAVFCQIDGQRCLPNVDWSRDENEEEEVGTTDGLITCPPQMFLILIISSRLFSRSPTIHPVQVVDVDDDVDRFIYLFLVFFSLDDNVNLEGGRKQPSAAIGRITNAAEFRLVVVTR